MSFKQGFAGVIFGNVLHGSLSVGRQRHPYDSVDDHGSPIVHCMRLQMVITFMRTSHYNMTRWSHFVMSICMSGDDCELFVSIMSSITNEIARHT
jgi:hypothetical protein